MSQSPRSLPPGDRERPGRPARLVDLLADSTELRDRPPTGGAWRADALAQSPHTRLTDLAREPLAEVDPERAAELCSAVCRLALGDFAPALLLLSAAERRRVRALAAYAYTLFDFARQGGVEGERLAAIGRWEFALEEALGGQPVGQPVFLRMALEERRRAWTREALDALGEAARRRATSARPATADESAARARTLAAALLHALLGNAPAAASVDFGAGLLRLTGLLRLCDELRAQRSSLPLSDLPEPLAERPTEAIVAAVTAEAHRLRPALLVGARAQVELPLAWRRPAAFLREAGLRLLAEIEVAPERLLARPPRLTAWSRLRLLWRSRSAAIRG